jgi:Cof subfamily protein (haloacid dehalogenase superfamily)
MRAIMLLLLGRRAVRCGAYALRRRSTKAPRVRATAADEVDLPYRGVLADLRLPDSLTDEDAFDAWAEERERRWTRDGALSGWLTLPPEKAALATHAWRRGFKLHHCAGDDLVLYKWLAEGEDKVPPWGNTQIGCAGFVVNDKGELLVVREWQPPKEGQTEREPSQNWKLPGGLADAGESFFECAARETFEETGIQCRGVSLLGMWHRHDLVPWGKSDLYCVVRLEPVDPAQQIKADPAEISACRWYDRDAFLRDEGHPLISKVLRECYGASDHIGASSKPLSECVDLGVQWPGRPRYATYFPRAAPPRMPSVVRAIASDVDGTLLDSSSKCHPAAAAAVADACAHDHVRFFIATGKCRAGALAALPPKISDVLEGGVFVNGLVAYDARGEIVHERRLDGAVIEACASFAAEHGFAPVAYDRDRLYTSMITPRTEELADRYYEPRPVVGSLDRDARANKILLLGDADALAAARPALAEMLGTEASLTVAIPTMLEVLPPGASKREGVRAFCDHHGIDEASELAAVGDGENDAEMLRAAALGVAVANAGAAAMNAADVVVASNDAGGAAQAIRMALALASPVR